MAVKITNITDGATVKGVVRVLVDAPGTRQINFFVDGVIVGHDKKAPFTHDWYTAKYPDGPHEIKAVSSNGASSDRRTVTVDNVADLVESPAGTAVPPAAQLVDKDGRVITITAAMQVAIDGTVDVRTSNVVKLAYDANHSVWQLNTSADWYPLLADGNWGPPTKTSPLEPAPTPTPAPSPAPVGIGDFVGACAGDALLVGQKGLKHARVDIWNLDRAKTDAARAAGVTVLPIACYQPFSGLSAGDHYHPDSHDHTVQWAQKMMAERFLPIFATPPPVIEVMNEPWVTNNWMPRDPEAYMDQVREFAKACWATPGYASTRLLVSCDQNGDWMRRLLAADTTGLLKNPLISPTTHNYCGGAPGSVSTQPCEWDFQRYKCPYDALKAYGHPDPKVYSTEAGWQSNTAGSTYDTNQVIVSEEMQRDYTITATNLAYQSGIVAKLYWYMVSPSSQTWSFNWVRPDGSEKPVVQAVRQLVAAG